MSRQELTNRGAGVAKWSFPPVHPEGRKFGLIAAGITLFDLQKQAKEIAAIKVAQRHAINKDEADAAARLMAARLAEAQAAHVAYA